MFGTCYYHPERQAVAKCDDCYKSLCQADIIKVEGMQQGIYLNKIVCKECAKNYPGLATTSPQEFIAQAKKTQGSLATIFILIFVFLIPFMILTFVFVPNFNLITSPSGGNFTYTIMLFPILGNVIFILLLFLIFRSFKKKFENNMLQP